MDGSDIRRSYPSSTFSHAVPGRDRSSFVRSPPVRARGVYNIYISRESIASLVAYSTPRARDVMSRAWCVVHARVVEV